MMLPQGWGAGSYRRPGRKTSATRQSTPSKCARHTAGSLTERQSHKARCHPNTDQKRHKAFLAYRTEAGGRFISPVPMPHASLSRLPKTFAITEDLRFARWAAIYLAESFSRERSAAERTM